MKKRERQPAQNDETIEMPKTRKESRSVEMKKERNKWLMAAFSAINLSGCGALPDVFPGIDLMGFKQLDASKLEQTDIVKTPQYQEIEKTLKGAGWNKERIATFTSEYQNGCIYGEVGDKKVLTPIFSSQQIEGEMRLYAEKPTKLIEAGITTEKEYDELLQQEARDLTIRMGFPVKIISNPAEANQVIRQVPNLRENKARSITVGEAKEDNPTHPIKIQGIGTIMMANRLTVELSDKGFLKEIEISQAESNQDKKYVFELLHRQVVEHEILHNQGLMHSNDKKSIMHSGIPYPSKDDNYNSLFGLATNALYDSTTVRMQGMKTFLDIKRSQHSNLNFLNADHI